MLTSVLRNLNVLTIDLVTLLTSILRWMDGRINKILCKHIIILKKKKIMKFLEIVNMFYNYHRVCDILI